MDGILEELLRLEGAKHHALIALDSAVYEDAVQKQLGLIDDPGVSLVVRSGADQLLAFSRLANINTGLYENLLASVPWIAVPSRSYGGNGRIADTPATHAFRAKG